ncbi:MAG: MerR family transcriptional regulator [Actinobacteria bacterium]|nr:MerR family transcriptional regulator [Actinomycetota bacterium]
MAGLERTESSDDRLTIDALAARTGLTSRNIRAFQTEGLLHAPRLEGRTGYYDRSHIDRLELIGRLQSEGFSRASIATLLDAWDTGTGLGDVLGIGADHPGILQPDRHIRTTLASFRERMGNQEWAIAEAVELRLATIDGDEVEILNPALFEIGREFAVAGFSLHAILQHARRLREAADNIAEHYIDELRANWRDDGSPGADEARDLTAMLLRLSPSITRSVDAALRQSMNDHLRDVLEHLDEPGSPSPR